MTRKIALLAWLVAVVGFMAGCDFADSPDEGSVVAWVEGTPIYQSDVDRAISETFGPGDFSESRSEVESAMLETLIRARVMSLKAEQELDGEVLQNIDAQLRKQRDELLMEAYIRRHAAPRAITPSDIEAYYREYPERFGAESRRHYVVLHANEELSGAQRSQVLSMFNNLDREADWAAISRQAQSDRLPVIEYEGTLNEQIFPERVIDAFSRLSTGEISDVVMVDGRPYIARLDRVEEIPPRPLSEVRDQIRRRLVPVHVQEALRTVSDDLMEEAEIEVVE